MILVAIACPCDRNFYVIFSVNSHVKKEAIAQFGRSQHADQFSSDITLELPDRTQQLTGRPEPSASEFASDRLHQTNYETDPQPPFPHSEAIELQSTA
ncbi:MAG: hypothetical protein JGK30_30290 [Microcoleus sp. PH2017_40_RAT_O_B]|jgi:hypothetical protein|uniref:hypothetical protein n=1 Tax=unclassified Microcoleus TaxID=2642155 RepID=UPI001D456D40|nr:MULTISPECIES: hypothetical protein [unclassified Microcoleus]MCC3575509.1 hypothetical protein [Microcoleus sp. PH2017_34_RAT_O_A]MCC3613636.1 hypothetical protein [Microcoleus sp. PH2017_40_RAT_O_B]